MDFAGATRAAGNRIRWKGVVAKSSVCPNNLARLCDRVYFQTLFFTVSHKN